jgi:lactate dehydrogenase-like 2-hydroxyacid dehydrogenase
LRDRKAGIVGMGRIGKAIAKRLDAFGVPVVYHSRNKQAGVDYKYYDRLIDMARDVDTLIVIVPGGAGLDVFANEPKVPKELIDMKHVVLFPHLGSSTEMTRAAMDQLVVDNILAWAAGKPPLTPVPETPYPPKKG